MKMAGQRTNAIPACKPKPVKKGLAMNMEQNTPKFNLPVAALSAGEPLIRRNLLMGAPLAVAALAVPALAKAAEPRETDRDRMIRVIEQLEAWQGWEPSSTVAAKAFSAWQMRKALDLGLPDPETAQMHVDYQRQKFEDYRRSHWFERDIADGKQYHLAPMEGTLA